MFEFAESVLKKEKEIISKELETLKRDLEDIESKIEIGSRFKRSIKLTIFSILETVFIVGALYDCIVEMTLCRYVETLRILRILASGLGIFTLISPICSIVSSKILIEEIKRGGKKHYKNKNSYIEKSKELTEKINLHNKKIADINIELDHIHYYNDHSQEPLYQATNEKEYEELMSIQENFDAYLEEYLNEPINYSSIDLELNHLQANYNKKLTKVYGKEE